MKLCEITLAVYIWWYDGLYHYISWSLYPTIYSICFFFNDNNCVRTMVLSILNGWTRSLSHIQTRTASPHTMHHCQIRNWLNTSRLHQMTSFPNFLIRYNLDFVHRFTWFVVVEFAKGIFLSYFRRLVLLLLLLPFVCWLVFVLLLCQPNK